MWVDKKRMLRRILEFEPTSLTRVILSQRPRLQLPLPSRLSRNLAHSFHGMVMGAATDERKWRAAGLTVTAALE